MNNTNAKETKKEGRLGMYYLKEVWLHHDGLRRQANRHVQRVEWKYINGVFNTLGIGLEPAIQYLMNTAPSFEEFENWVEKNGNVSKEMIAYFNSVIAKEGIAAFAMEEEVLSTTDLEHWNQEGYVIVKGAIPEEDCAATVELICQEIGADLADPTTWYKFNPLKKGIMIQLFDSPILDKNRLSRKIRLAYEQLWQRNDLMVSMDRVSFNPPETEAYKFPGPDLHWDMSLKKPIPLGLQGLLYLTDTDENQGAFTVIPGFQNKINTWLDELAPGINPRDKTILDAFEAKPIAAKAGDFIIWNQCLPHGSSPNTSTQPRIVQYINYQPLEMEYQNEWI